MCEPSAIFQQKTNKVGRTFADYLVVKGDQTMDV